MSLGLTRCSVYRYADQMLLVDYPHLHSAHSRVESISGSKDPPAKQWTRGRFIFDLRRKLSPKPQPLSHLAITKGTATPSAVPLLRSALPTCRERCGYEPCEVCRWLARPCFIARRTSLHHARPTQACTQAKRVVPSMLWRLRLGTSQQLGNLLVGLVRICLCHLERGPDRLPAWLPWRILVIGVGDPAHGPLVRRLGPVEQLFEVVIRDDVVVFVLHQKHLLGLERQQLRCNLAQLVFLLLAHGERGLVARRKSELALLDDERLELAFVASALEDLLLHRIRRHESEDQHGLGLADAVNSVLRLQIHLRVPVRVVEDDRVGSDQVDAETTGARAEQEQVARILALVLVERLHLRPPLFLRRSAVDAAGAQLLELVGPLLDDVEHGGKLAKDEHLVPTLEERIEQSVEHEHLARRIDEVLVDHVGARRLVHGPVEQKGMVANLACLHDDVFEMHVFDLALRLADRVELALSLCLRRGELLGLAVQLLLEPVKVAVVRQFVHLVVDAALGTASGLVARRRGARGRDFVVGIRARRRSTRRLEVGGGVFAWASSLPLFHHRLLLGLVVVNSNGRVAAALGGRGDAGGGDRGGGGVDAIGVIEDLLDLGPRQAGLALEEPASDLAADDRVVELLLELGERRIEEILLLGRQVGLDVCLEPTQEERLEDLVELGDDLGGVFLREDAVGALVVVNVGKVEPGLERGEVVKDVGQDKVEERPEFGEVVVERGAREDEAVGALEELEFADEAAVEVLEAVALVDDDKLPRVVGEPLAVADDELVAGDDDGEAHAGVLVLGQAHLLVAHGTTLVGVP
ncbi:hypothetical protein L1887_61750 [Cichorium endivia]|nr:hypothetical protein L1887_61750 [Cichorium endivia]